MLSQGFEKVYQLDGGVLNYLEDVEDHANQWRGECFVFDQRVSLTNELEQGRYQQCFACRHPISAADLDSLDYEEGVSCPHCADDLDERRQGQFRERQRQVNLAQTRGIQHIGAPQPQHISVDSACPKRTGAGLPKVAGMRLSGQQPDRET